MKRYSLLTLFLLTISLTVSAAVTFTDKPNYPNLVFTVLDEEAKTVSVKAESIAYYTQDSILNIPASVTNSGDTYTVTTIAADGFKAIKIKQIILPSTIKTIESAAFRDITSPFTIELNEGLTTIGNRAFAHCTGISDTIVLPSTLSTIYSFAAFYNVPTPAFVIRSNTPPTISVSETYGLLPNIPIVIPSGTRTAYTTSEWSKYKQLFCDEQSFTDGVYMFTVLDAVSYKVKIKGKLADITVIDLSETVVNPFNKSPYTISAISDSCFMRDTAITSVSLPATIDSIGRYAFYDCSKITSLSLNEGLQIIGERSFTKCKALTGALVLPSTLTKIGEAAFFDDSLLTEIHINAIVPPTIAYVSFNAFTCPSAVFMVTCDTYNEYINSTSWSKYKKQFVNTCIFSDDTYTYQILHDEDSKVSVKSLLNNDITEVNIPNSVTNPYDKLDYAVTVIADSCFINKTTISTVTLPTTILNIGNRAFYGCSALTTINLNEGLKVIGERAFTKCTAISGTLVLPSTLTEIGAAAFNGDDIITQIQINAVVPPTMVSDSYAAFTCSRAAFMVTCDTYNDYINSVSWSKYKSQFVNTCIFSDETYTYQVLLDEDSKVSVKALLNSEITEVNIPNSVTNPYDKLNYAVTAIADGCFKGNTTISSVTLPNTLHTIGTSAFDGCSNLTDLELNLGLKVIGYRAFTATGLKDTLNIPGSVDSIGLTAFAKCFNVEVIRVYSTVPPTVPTITHDFDNIFFVDKNTSSKLYNAPIIVPCGSMETYRNANYWKDLSNKFVSACKPLKLTKGVALTQDTIVSSISYSRTFDMDVWQTLYLPFEVDSVFVYDEQDAKYYDINYPFKPGYGGYFYLNEYDTTNVEEATITFTTATSIEKNTPYLIQFPTTDDRYFEGKDIVFKSTAGEYTLNKLDYSQPKATTQFEVSGNSSVYNQSVSDMYIFRATHVTGKDGKDSVKYEFNRQASDTLKPFEFGLLPYVVEPSSGISSAPMRMSLRIGRSSGNTGGGGITTSVSETHASNAITYRTGAGELALSLNGLPCQLYSISGTLLYSSAGGTEEITIPLEKGIYILYSEGKSQKIVL